MVRSGGRYTSAVCPDTVQLCFYSTVSLHSHVPVHTVVLIYEVLDLQGNLLVLVARRYYRVHTYEYKM